MSSGMLFGAITRFVACTFCGGADPLDSEDAANIIERSTFNTITTYRPSRMSSPFTPSPPSPSPRAPSSEAIPGKASGSTIPTADQRPVSTYPDDGQFPPVRGMVQKSTPGETRVGQTNLALVRWAPRPFGSANTSPSLATPSVLEILVAFRSAIVKEGLFGRARPSWLRARPLVVVISSALLRSPSPPSQQVVPRAPELVVVATSGTRQVSADDVGPESKSAGDISRPSVGLLAPAIPATPATPALSAHASTDAAISEVRTPAMAVASLPESSSTIPTTELVSSAVVYAIKRNPASTSPFVALPNVFPGIEVGQVLGQGAFGQVWSGSWKGQRVAIKIGSAAPGPHQAMFENECLAMTECTGPHVLPLLRFSMVGHTSYMVCPMAAHGDLHQLARRQLFNVRDVVRVGIEVLSGLHSMNRRGFIHKDIKAANILVGEHNGTRRAMVGDLGLAECIGSGRSQICSGTPGYQAREVILAQPHGFAADVYSTGVLLHSLWQGQEISNMVLSVLMKEANAKGQSGVCQAEYLECLDDVGCHGGEMDWFEGRRWQEGLGPELREIILAMCHPNADERPDLKSLTCSLTSLFVAAEREAKWSYLEGPDIKRSDG